MRFSELLRSKQWAFKKLFKVEETGELHEASKVALADLRTFCNGTKSNFNIDPLEMARMEGRREVFMRIMNFLNYDYSKIYDLEEDIVDE